MCLVERGEHCQWKSSCQFWMVCFFFFLTPTVQLETSDRGQLSSGSDQYIPTIISKGNMDVQLTMRLLSFNYFFSHGSLETKWQEARNSAVYGMKSRKQTGSCLSVFTCTFLEKLLQKATARRIWNKLLSMHISFVCRAWFGVGGAARVDLSVSLTHTYMHANTHIPCWQLCCEGCCTGECTRRSERQRGKKRERVCWMERQRHWVCVSLDRERWY